MTFAFDHVVVVVTSLEAATVAFRDAGFWVEPGGRHDALPTENALVVFEDGGYLELLAARDPAVRDELRAASLTPKWPALLHEASAVARRFLPALAGPDGVADVVLRATRLDRFALEARHRGFVMTGPVRMERERPDGERLAWSLVLPESRVLPFLIEDRTARERRVPVSPETTAHSNGARGVQAVEVFAGDVPTWGLAYADLFDVVPRVRSDGATELALPGVRIVLRQGAPEGARAVRLEGAATLPVDVLPAGIEGAQEP